MSSKFHSLILVTRPNVGCRELVKRNLIRILPAIRNDLTDWVVSGRVKAAQLLAILTWQGEESITQHLEDTLQVCAKALTDDEAVVRERVSCIYRLIEFPKKVLL